MALPAGSDRYNNESATPTDEGWYYSSYNNSCYEHAKIRSNSCTMYTYKAQDFQPPLLLEMALVFRGSIKTSILCMMINRLPAKPMLLVG